MVGVGYKMGLLPQPNFELVDSDNGRLEVIRTSLFTRKRNTMRLPMTREEFAAWQGGALIQDVWPDMTADQREFLISGATPEEWEAEFPEE